VTNPFSQTIWEIIIFNRVHFYNIAIMK
jgi:hypothetical protein